ncbi:Cytochrome c oxidase assembly protein COX20, mitochondrial [Plasmodiophora brassicae]
MSMEKAPAYDPLDPMFSVKRMPCFRNACLWGIFTGLAMGAHRYRRTQSLWLATDRGIKTMLGMSLVTWVMCRRSFFERKAAIDSIMKRNEMNENQTKVVLD